MKGHERLEHGLAQTLVQGESLPTPVARRAEASDLVTDATAVLLFPFPRPALEFVAADALAGQSLRFEGPLHDELRGDPRVVRAG